ncbi:MAG TPA: hypothetical protein VIV54_16980 [Burkholderiales bacterium]
MGSLLDVAMLLEVEPKQVYLWIADLEHPSEERVYELEKRLRLIGAASNSNNH